MAVEDNPPSDSTDKIIPFSIPNKVPIKLDLEKHNYNSWSSFSFIHLDSLGLKAHVEEDNASTNPEWCQLDDLIKIAINLDNELRTIKIGKMTVNEYCTKIQSMENRLKNLDCQVSEKNLVIYAVNGLDSRFATLAEIIRHREPLPTFETPTGQLVHPRPNLYSPVHSPQPTQATFLARQQPPQFGYTSQPHPDQGLLGPTPAHYCSQATTLPITNTGHSIIPSIHRPLHLHNVLVTPNIIKNLILVRQFTRDNNCTIKFDALGFFVKDFLTRYILLQCDSSGDLYPVTKSSTTPTAFLTTSASTWHQRLGHPGDEV
ncbi:hypothetical protein Tco_1278568, partial [Tanacetum coccineum]